MDLFNSKQNGSTLIVALALLAVITLIGVSAVQSVGFQVKMATYTKKRTEAFFLAEAALTNAEFELNSDGHEVSLVQDCASGSSNCFDTLCTGGLCFGGAYTSGANAATCALDATSPPPDNYWRRASLDVWNTASRHREYDKKGFPDYDDPKYIVEFMCYADRSYADALICESTAPANCVALYRITALAESKDGKSQVMLQSTVRVDSI